MRQVGAARSGVIDENGVILAGNGTYEALAAAGINKVRVIEADGNEWVVVQRKGLTEEQKRALAIADNRSAELAEWDGPALAAQGIDLVPWFSDVELIKIGARSATEADNGPDPQLDKAEALREQYGVELGQIWALGEHRLMCGDSTKAEDVDGLLQGAKPFLCVTDPPYGVDYHPQWRIDAAAKGHLAYAAIRVGLVTNDDRADWRATWALFPGDVIYSWHPAGATSLVHAAALQDSGFILRMQIIWAKSNFPIGRGDYHVRHEPCWYAVRKGRPAQRTDDRTQTTLWEINLDRNVDGGHSTQKPLECMARPIRNHDAPDVYDPFLGSGTTLIACEQLGRKCYAMEISPAYVAVAIQRWVDLTGKEPQLLNG